MAESTENPANYSIPVLNNDGSQTGIYLYLDSVSKTGITKIITYWNIRNETRANEFDNSQYTMYVYNMAWIKNWSLPGFYTKNGAIVQLGVTDENGYRIIQRSEVENYIRANAAEIAGFAQVTKMKYIN